MSSSALIASIFDNHSERVGGCGYLHFEEIQDLAVLMRSRKTDLSLVFIGFFELCKRKTRDLQESS